MQKAERFSAELGERDSIRYHLQEGFGKQLGYRFEQFGRLDPQRVGQSNDVYERDIPFAPLDTAYVVAMQIRQFSQLLLREAAFKAQLAHLLSERSSGVAAWHAAIIGLMTTMSLHTMSVIKI